MFTVDTTVVARSSAAAPATPASAAALAEERSGLYCYSVRDALTVSQRRPLVASPMAARPDERAPGAMVVIELSVRQRGDPRRRGLPPAA